MDSIRDFSVPLSKFYAIRYESPKKRRTFILPSMMTENSIVAFHHVLMVTLYALQKLFFTDKTFDEDFDFFNPIPGGGVIFTSPIYLGKYLTNLAQN